MSKQARVPVSLSAYARTLTRHTQERSYSLFKGFTVLLFVKRKIKKLQGRVEGVTDTT